MKAKRMKCTTCRGGFLRGSDADRAQRLEDAAVSLNRYPDGAGDSKLWQTIGLALYELSAESGALRGRCSKCQLDLVRQISASPAVAPRSP